VTLVIGRARLIISVHAKSERLARPSTVGAIGVRRIAAYTSAPGTY
jgi:hypothetical protein